MRPAADGDHAAPVGDAAVRDGDEHLQPAVQQAARLDAQREPHRAVGAGAPAGVTA
jgi:hypothetical protein